MNEFEIEEMKDFQEATEPRKRPKFLLFLAILTFIGSGYSCLYFTLLPLVKTQLPDMMSVYGDFLQKMGANAAAEIEQVLTFLAGVASWKYLVAAFCHAGSVVGAALMLKMQKKGLHIYICAQIACFAVLSFLIGDMLKPQIGDILWTAIFITLYYTQLKKSRVF